GAVVRPPVEGSWFCSQITTLIGKIIKENLLNILGAIRTGQRGGGAVAIIDKADEVGRTEHVEIQIDSDVLNVAIAQRTDVVQRAKQTFLLRTPPGKAHFVSWLDVKLCHLQGNLQDRGRATAVVIDARPC